MINESFHWESQKKRILALDLLENQKSLVKDVSWLKCHVIKMTGELALLVVRVDFEEVFTDTMKEFPMSELLLTCVHNVLVCLFTN
jgi:hypothetical protein